VVLKDPLPSFQMKTHVVIDVFPKCKKENQEETSEKGRPPGGF